MAKVWLAGCSSKILVRHLTKKKNDFQQNQLLQQLYNLLNFSLNTSKIWLVVVKQNHEGVSSIFQLLNLQIHLLI